MRGNRGAILRRLSIEAPRVQQLIPADEFGILWAQQIHHRAGEVSQCRREPFAQRQRRGEFGEIIGGERFGRETEGRLY